MQFEGSVYRLLAVWKVNKNVIVFMRIRLVMVNWVELNELFVKYILQKNLGLAQIDGSHPHLSINYIIMI